MFNGGNYYLCMRDFCIFVKLGKISGLWAGVHRTAAVQPELRDFTGGQVYEILNGVVSGAHQRRRRRLRGVWASVV